MSPDPNIASSWFQFLQFIDYRRFSTDFTLIIIDNLQDLRDLLFQEFYGTYLQIGVLGVCAELILLNQKQNDYQEKCHIEAGSSSTILSMVFFRTIAQIRYLSVSIETLPVVEQIISNYAIKYIQKFRDYLNHLIKLLNILLYLTCELNSIN